MRRLFHLMAAAISLTTLTTACLNTDDPYNAGFVFQKPTAVANGIYANNTADSIVFYSYGNWRLTHSGSDWCQAGYTTGPGSTVNRIPLTFQQNTTGRGREALFTITDSDHPDDAYTRLYFWQFATRGDGSMGSAADVKSITGTDGSQFSFTYDAWHRPTSLRITADGVTIRSLTLTYNDTDSTMTVLDMTKTLKGKYGRNLQPQTLVGEGDTIGYGQQYYANGMPVSSNYAFNVEHRSTNGQKTIYAYLLGGQPLTPDSLHRADSLRIAEKTGHSLQYDIRHYAMEYSAHDNRCQSIDANQLVFGAQQCDPYQLLSLFRYARSTSILRQMKSDDSTHHVDIELNADKSVHTMTVTTTGKDNVQTDTPVTYTLEY